MTLFGCRSAMLLALVVTLPTGLGCIPEGPPTGFEPEPGGTNEPLARPASESRGPAVQTPAPDPALGDGFRDDFERGDIGPDYRVVSASWRIVGGELCGEAAKNRGIWLERRLPVNARIAFDARSDSDDGDIKVEAWGDGRSGATGVSYDDATSYVLIFGGWKNSRHALARLDEHGDDVKLVSLSPEAEEPRRRPVAKGQRYRFVIERRDGRTIRWSVDGVVVHELSDAVPLKGPGHDHFGFNDWMTPVCFDNLEIVPL